MLQKSPEPGRDLSTVPLPRITYPPVVPPGDDARVWLSASGLLLLVWAHGIIGLHFTLRSRDGYQRWRDPFLLAAILIPILALIGFAVGGREAGRMTTAPDIITDAQIVMFNHSLSPSQERNLEKELQCRVLDRTGLILDIFAQRARTHEGKLQVELAQLDYLLPRLAGAWSHLERLGGGIGTRGPGERKLETDRRKVRDRIARIRRSVSNNHLT
jgi:hypothetical protein